MNRGHSSGARADVMLAGGFASYVPVVASCSGISSGARTSLDALAARLLRVSRRGGVGRAAPGALRHPPRGADLGGVRRRHPRHHGTVRALVAFAEPWCGASTWTPLARVLGGVPVPRHRVLQSAAQPRAGPGGSHLRSGPPAYRRRCARSRRRWSRCSPPGDRGPHPGGGDETMGVGRATVLLIDEPPGSGGGLTRRLGGGQLAVEIPSDHPSWRSSGCGEGARARGLRRGARPGAPRGLPGDLRHARGRCSCPSCSAWTCWA